ncbi:hypothetical protein SDC9_84420 [bioreactor metagenome]|uniref:Polysaccharide biosynthesis protein C-terminal domain-containing protein n=1 Tax=bioreactor metagenome TaxID=1076179 RepID=A0A644ZD43_9ZZZZ
MLSIAGLYAVVSFPFQPLDGLIESGEWFIFHKTANLVDRVLNVLFMVLALLLGFGLYSLVAVRAISGIIVIGMKLRFLHKKDPQPIAWLYYDKKLMKEIFSFSMWVMIISVAQRLILSITPSILGITSGSREIAIFSVASSIEGYIWSFSTVFGGMFLPKVSQLMFGDNKNPGAIQELMIKVGRIQYIILGAIVSIFIMVGKDFYLNWVGEDFTKSFIITIFLILPGLITVPQQIGSTVLIASNQVRFNAMSKIIVAIISLTLSYLLSQKYGATGSGVAIFIGNLIGGALMMNIIYSKVLKINIWKFFKMCQLSMSAPFIIVVFTGLALNYHLTILSWTNIFIKVSTLFIIYATTAYFMALNKYEKNPILDLVKKVIR